MINGKNFFDQPINNDFKTYENIRELSLVKEIIIQLLVCLQSFPYENYCECYKKLA